METGLSQGVNQFSDPPILVKPGNYKEFDQRPKPKYQNPNAPTMKLEPAHYQIVFSDKKMVNPIERPDPFPLRCQFGI